MRDCNVLTLLACHFESAARTGEISVAVDRPLYSKDGALAQAAALMRHRSPRYKCRRTHRSD